MRALCGRWRRGQCGDERRKIGRLLILFVGLVISSYVHHTWNMNRFKEKISSAMDVLDEMHSIHCSVHNGMAKFITPFVGAQKDIYEAFGFAIPERLQRGLNPEKSPRRIAAVPQIPRLSNLRVNCTNIG